MPDLRSILREYWGYNNFRPLQESVIQSVMEGNDTLALMPTGGGKSICFQVPAMAMEGLCLVISPLIALMKDQVGALRKKGITAFAIVSGMSRRDLINTMKLATAANCRFLYVSPERLETSLFLEFLPALDIRIIAVDEAHCISQWGYDFRPSYLRISALREQLPGVPVIALTASATAIVQKDICERLLFKKENIIRQSFERPALSYSVFPVESKILRLVEILKKVPGSSIVYCKSRKRTREIAEQLNSYRINADYYHAGLSSEERSTKQDAWINDKTACMVCTNAFGMGIDKSAVRAVVHVDAPDCLENYYQESGRAGRDGKKSYAVLLYQQKDFDELEVQAEQRFPRIEEIKNVYQALINHLQLPNGSGGGNYYDFELNVFVSKFPFPVYMVMNTLKVLQQEGILSFNEQVFIPSKIEFICNKDTLYVFEKEHPKHENLIKTLLRSYEGIFDQAVFIFEKSLASQLRSSPEILADQLKTIQSYGILKYYPQKDNPQVYFMQDRVKKEDLFIDQKKYAERKKLYFARLKDFILYSRSVECRSKVIGNYFGDLELKACGICDNCLKRKRTGISRTEFTELETKILFELNNPVHPKTLMERLDRYSKTSAATVIDFLTAEQLIEINVDGMLVKKS
ncbi:MAG: ATP-dependent DNA helicase RecQ [Chitinophagaceae bacterium]